MFVEIFKMNISGVNTDFWGPRTGFGAIFSFSIRPRLGEQGYIDQFSSRGGGTPSPLPGYWPIYVADETQW